jgi:type 1 glutamine amidotransferase
MMEEWYAMEKFAPDLHVILLQQTKGMKDACYERPPFPATWARMHERGRVFYTSFGHRDDVWNHPAVQSILLGGIAWTMGNVDADVTPNLAKVAPQANQLKY